ncbi:MAG: IS110 family transposase [Ignavibacteria bacterium]|nr:IS110 family transposase [Ignavibacteria bacterium]
MKQVTKLSFKGQSIYVGMDVHKKSWKVSLFTDTFELRTMSIPPSVEVLKCYLHKMYPEATYYSVYEAGYCGYWIHEKLQKEGIFNIIVNAADVPTTDKEKKRKTDPVDSRKLGRSLRSGELKSIYIPSEIKQNDRLLVRSRHDNVKKQTRCKNQIKSVLNFFGIFISDEKIKTHWSKAYIQWLKSLCNDTSGRSIKLKTLITELEYFRKTISDLTKSIRALSLDPAYKKYVKLLTTIPGISTLTAMIILTEFGDMKIYSSLNKLSSYVGLIPDEHTSSDNEKRYGVTKRGNRYLRKALLESSWVAIRKDPSLTLSYRNYLKRTIAVKSIIKIARKLLNRIRYVLITEKEYQLLKP